MAKISSRKLIHWELLRLHFRRKILGAANFMERHSKGEFHVLVKEIKLFHHEFFFKHTATWHIDFLTVMFDSVCFLIGCIQQFHWLIIVLNNFFRFEVERKKPTVPGKEIIVFLVGVLAQRCGKISEVDSGAFTATKICVLGCYTEKIFCSEE